MHPPMFIKNDHLGDRVTSYYHPSINYKLSENKDSVIHFCARAVLDIMDFSK